MKEKYLPLAAKYGAFFLVSVFLIVATKRHSTNWNTQLRVLVPPPKALTHLVFGHDNTVADVLWIRTIQDIEYCEDNGCERGWTYQMLDMITDLDPFFRQPLALGTVSLSLISEDLEGATLLFDKAMASFPDDWTYFYRAGYHSMENEKKLEKAANLFRLAAERGAPSWVYSLATKNYLKANRRQLAETMYQSLLGEDIPEAVLRRIRERIDTNNSGHLDIRQPDPSVDKETH